MFVEWQRLPWTPPGGDVFDALFLVAFRDPLFPSLDSSEDSTSPLVDMILLFFRTGEPVVTNIREEHLFCVFGGVASTISSGSSVWATRDDSSFVFSCFWFVVFMSAVCVELLLLELLSDRGLLVLFFFILDLISRGGWRRGFGHLVMVISWILSVHTAEAFTIVIYSRNQWMWRFCWRRSCGDYGFKE